MKVIPLCAFSDNYIWVIHSSSSNAVTVVDPGDANPVIDYIECHDLSLETILITHHHNDHIGGVQTLKNRYQCQVFAPKRDNQPFADRDLGILHFMVMTRCFVAIPCLKPAVGVCLRAHLRYF